jgi:hypothetical protein
MDDTILELGDRVFYTPDGLEYIVTHIDWKCTSGGLPYRVYTIDCMSHFGYHTLRQYNVNDYLVKVGNKANPTSALLTPGETEKKCDHKFVSYHGFREQYEFCKMCDEKRPLT